MEVGVMDVWVEDWALAKTLAARDGAEAHVKIMQDLVPKDRFTRNLEVYEVLWWPSQRTGEKGWENHAWSIEVRTVLGVTAERSLDMVPGWSVAAWPARELDYGRARCGHCQCHVDRTHVPGSEECQADFRERYLSQRDWTR